ncbi:MAG TPA: polyprenyl synthetase family protein [Actinobacteria bacterium]|nr:polyprenyl synthetase family protein [Actinomycetota bacterium]
MRFFGDKKPVSAKTVSELRAFEKRFLTIFDRAEPNITSPSVAAIKAGGKRLRPALAIICAGLGDRYDHEKMFSSCAAVELVHLASLIHDDVLDDSATRRGVSTISADYGAERAINIGNYLFGLSFQLLADQNDSKLIGYLARASIYLSEGELQQKQVLRRLDQSIDDYLTRIYTKTAALFEASCLMGASIGGLPDSYNKYLQEYARSLGMAFQIYDDILDFTGDARALGKPTGSDIREGTITLPMIFALQRDGKELIRAIRDPDQDNIKEAVDAVIECGAIEEATKVAKGYVDTAGREVNKLPECPARKDLVSLGNFVIDRYH